MAVDRAMRRSNIVGRREMPAWLRTILVYGAYIFASAVFVFPFLWAISGSLKTGYQLEEFPPRLLPDPIQWHNYLEIWGIVPLARFIWNTVLITLVSMAGGISSAALVAYGFARFRFPGRDVLFTILLGTMMLPAQVTLIPQFVMFFKLHWIDTYLPLTVPSFFGGGAFGIFLLRQFFRTLPMELDEAAKIDGASYPRIFFTILLPLSKPALIALAIRRFLDGWGNFLGPLIYLNSTEKMTVSVGLRYLAETARFQADLSGEPTTHLLMAASVVATIPSILVYVVAQRYLIEGIVLTGSKG
jgi:multiple sugar transport system permease protein